MTLNNFFYKPINITHFRPFIMDSFSTTCFNSLLKPSSGGLTICCTVIINLHVSILSWRKVLLFMDKLLLKLLCIHSQRTAMFQAHSKLLKGNKVIISLKLNKIGILILKILFKVAHCDVMVEMSHVIHVVYIYLARCCFFFLVLFWCFFFLSLWLSSLRL
jgi:hypothetical protein